PVPEASMSESYNICLALTVSFSRRFFGGKQAGNAHNAPLPSSRTFSCPENPSAPKTPRYSFQRHPSSIEARCRDPHCNPPAHKESDYPSLNNALADAPDTKCLQECSSSDQTNAPAQTISPAHYPPIPAPRFLLSASAPAHRDFPERPD